MTKHRMGAAELSLTGLVILLLLIVAGGTLIVAIAFFFGVYSDKIMIIINLITLGIATTGIFLNLINWLRSYKQTEIQDKTSSANLVLKIKSVEESDFTDLVDRIQKGVFNKKDNEKLTTRFLIHLNMVAHLHEKDLIDIDDVKHVYGHLLQSIQENDYIKKLIGDDKTGYPELEKLCNKIKDT